MKDKKDLYRLNVIGITILEQLVKSLERESQTAYELKDYGAYNRIQALKLNIKEFLAYFEKRDKEMLKNEKDKTI